MVKITLTLIILIAHLISCGGSSNSDAPVKQEIIDPPTSSLPSNNLNANPEGNISYQKLQNRNPDCTAYLGQYQAEVYDLQQNTTLSSSLTISSDDTHCLFSSNNTPNHDVGGNTTTGKDFASIVRENSINFELKIAKQPTKQSVPIYIDKIAGMLTLNGILLNGVDLDMDSAFCYHPDINASLNVGLGTREQCGLDADWYAIPANNPEIVTLDEFAGHAFDGRYHYHGDNAGLSNYDEFSSAPHISDVDASGSPVIGFAPDGFPIYGHYFYDTELGSLRKPLSSWKTYTIQRQTPNGSDIAAPSIDTHPRGMFVEDWYYENGVGDLDECNGMTDAYGNYGYYYTETYPYGPICVFGNPDSSFIQSGSAFVGQD